MASDHSDAIQVKPEDLYEDSEGVFEGAPVTHVDAVQEVSPSEEQKHVLEKQQEAQEDAVAEGHPEPIAEGHSEPITHETGAVKTTYDTEDDATNPTLKAKVKGKIEKIGDKLRPKDAVQAKNADPHPNLV